MNKLMLCAILLVPSPLGCVKQQHQLADLADKIPVTLKCEPITDATIQEWLNRYDASPAVVVEAELKNLHKQHPVVIACLLLEAMRYMRENNLRESPAYLAANDALKALGVIK